MHELAVTQSTLDLALKYAGGRRITAIYLVVGELSSIVDDSVQFYWDFISRETLAEGAVLRFERIPARFRCRDCGESYLLRESELVCPSCGSQRVELACGDEFYLSAIDVDEDEVEDYAKQNSGGRKHPERQ